MNRQGRAAIAGDHCHRFIEHILYFIICQKLGAMQIHYITLIPDSTGRLLSCGEAESLA